MQLGLKDATRPFPTGTAVGVLKWRAQTTDETLVPITINCWPTQTGGDSWEVTIYPSPLAFTSHPSSLARLHPSLVSLRV